MNTLRSFLFGVALTPCLACMPLLPAHAADAATLRSFVSLQKGSVLLSDLFENAGARGDAVLGAAPPPGQKLTLEAPQLAAIARSYGVDWKPPSPGVRLVLERPGRTLARAEVERLLRDALEREGVASTAEVELSGFMPPTVPMEPVPQISVDNLELDAATGRFSAMLEVLAEGLPAQRMRLNGRAMETVEALFPTRRITAGTVLREGDLQLRRVRAISLRAGNADSLPHALGRQLRRTATPDMPLMAADLQAPILVERNALVTLTVQSPGMSLTAQGRAADPGGLGEVIAVMNLGSRTIVQAEVIGPGRVRAIPGTGNTATNAQVARLASQRN